mmetsp:Transcript_20731/g.45002  ORF Transcript_20731/g.45002 Transcript_20731/m.45002 type:complete len:252 (-) Transcript_20731:419-1174(-)
MVTYLTARREYILMLRVRESPTNQYTMTSQKSRANMEACQMIEAMLFELNPSLDKKQANRLARQLVSFRAFQKSLDSNTGIECLQLRLKKLSQMLLNVADRRRRRQASSSKLPTSPTPANAKDVSTMVQNLSLDTQDAHQTEVTTRHHILINTVGESKYNDILSVHREILRIRQQSAVWTKFSPIRQLRHDKFDDNRHLIHEEEEEEEENDHGLKVNRLFLLTILMMLTAVAADYIMCQVGHHLGFDLLLE